MKKVFSSILGTVLVAALALTAAAEVPAAGYPASGATAPEGSVVIAGSLIGNEAGWGDNAAAGRAAAFDGDVATFFDPLGTGDGYCGVDAGKPYVITKIVICPRDGYTDRFYGATIQGTNTPDDEDSWVDIWMSLDSAEAAEYVEINSDEFDVTDEAFQYFRYYNMLSHGDVAEVELYGYPQDGVVEAFPAGEETATEEATETTTEETATEATTEEATATLPESLEYPSADPIANSGAGYESLEEAAASIGKTPITDVTYVDGSSGNGGEGAENLWDNNTATKFCTADFPTQSMAVYANPITVDGIIMATANDNASYNQRSPYEWAIYVSADGVNWTAIAYGDDYFFEETNYTYYAAEVTPVEGVKYVYFQSEGALSGTFQMSELVLTGTVSEATVEATETTETVETEETVETVETTKVEETIETVETEATEETTEEAPQTFDAGVIAAVAAVVSAAGYAVSKKRN